MAAQRSSSCYVCTLDVASVCDMQQLQIIKKTVRISNARTGQKKRVVIRGRKPFKKMVTGSVFYPASKGEVGYDRAGNIVGGIKNASLLDVYIYDRRF